MPNWCYNQFTVVHEDQQMIERFVKAVEENKLLNEFIPMPKELEDTTSPSRDTNEQLIEKYGYNNWYNWRIDNWGTKWDISSGAVVELIGNEAFGSFSTAWSPPIPFFEALTDLGFDVNITYDEEGMGFLGIYNSVEGEIYQEYPNFEDPDWRKGIINPDILALLDQRYDTWLEEQEELEQLERING